MKWFSNLSTRGKFLIAFGVPLCIMLLQIYYTQNMAFKLMQTRDDEFREHFTEVHKLSQIQSGIDDVYSDVFDYLENSERSDKRNMKVKIETALQKTTNIINEGIQSNQSIGHIDDVAQFTTLLNQYEDYKKLILQVLIEANEPGKFSDAKKLFAKDCNDLQDALLKNIAETQTTFTASTNKAMEETKIEFKSGYSMSVIITIVLLIPLYVLLTFVLNKVIAQPLKNITSLAQLIANGDLTVTLTNMDRKDEVGVLNDVFIRMVGTLRKVMQDISETVSVLGSSASEISASTSELAASSTETATAVSETTTTVEEIRQTASISNQKAKQVAESSQRAVQVSQTGRQSTNETVEGINKIGTQMESIAESIIKLSEQSRAIAEIIASVNDLAEQTNLLSVNASIEAAKAGEQGKGFAVVAQEIKNLADQSKQATTQVRTILNDIQNAISGAVMSTEQGNKAVDSTIIQSGQTAAAIETLSRTIEEAAQAAVQIAASSQQQSVGMDQTVRAMENIKLASTQNASTTKQLESASHILKDMGQKLQQLIEQFKV